MNDLFSAMKRRVHTAIQRHGHTHTHNKPHIGSVVITDCAYLLVWIAMIYSWDGGRVHQHEQIISEIIVFFFAVARTLYLSHCSLHVIVAL